MKIESFIFSCISKKHNDLSLQNQMKQDEKLVIYEAMSLKEYAQKTKNPASKDLNSVSRNLLTLSYQMQQRKAIWIGTTFTQSRGWGGFSWSVQRCSVSSLSWPKMKTAVTTRNLSGHAIIHWITCISPDLTCHWFTNLTRKTLLTPHAFAF